MTNIRKQAIAYGRLWLGTPWKHHQRCLGVGVDCVQFLCAIADNIGIPQQLGNYYRIPVRDSLYQRMLENGFIEKPIEERLPGDIAVFKLGGIPHHTGLITEVGLIHADMFSGRVVEQRLDDRYRKRLIHLFDLEKSFENIKYNC